MLNKWKLFYIVLTLTLILSSTTVYGSNSIQIFLNDVPLTMDVNPVILEGRTLVPFRAIFEAIDADITWDESSQTASGLKGNTQIDLTIGQYYGYVNGTPLKLDVPAVIINNRTMVPLRFVSENLGFDVIWDGANRSIYLNNGDLSDREFIFNEITIGSSKADLINAYGEPQRIDRSIYGFEWYVYNRNYADYIQIGVSSNKVVAVYTNNGSWESKNGLKDGTPQSKVRSLLGAFKKEIVFGDTYMEYPYVDVFTFQGNTVLAMYDHLRKDQLSSIFIAKSSIYNGIRTPYPNQSEDMSAYLEMQIFDQANAIRQKFGLPLFSYDRLASVSAKTHAEDMATRDYFDHYSLEGLSPFDRMSAVGIDYYSAAENISCGRPTSFLATEAWMNSADHRGSLLGDYSRLGVGVSFGGYYGIYYDQNFYTPD